MVVAALKKGKKIESFFDQEAMSRSLAIEDLRYTAWRCSSCLSGGPCL